MTARSQIRSTHFNPSLFHLPTQEVIGGDDDSGYDGSSDLSEWEDEGDFWLSEEEADLRAGGGMQQQEQQGGGPSAVGASQQGGTMFLGEIQGTDAEVSDYLASEAEDGGEMRGEGISPLL